MFARTQLEHGFSLLHLTFRLRHVTQERGLRPLAEDVEADRAGFAGEALAPELDRLGDSLRRVRWSLGILLKVMSSCSPPEGEAESGSSVIVERSIVSGRLGKWYVGFSASRPASQRCLSARKCFAAVTGLV